MSGLLGWHVNQSKGSGFRGLDCLPNLLENRLNKAPLASTQNHYGDLTNIQVLLVNKVLFGRKKDLKTGVLGFTK